MKDREDFWSLLAGRMHRCEVQMFLIPIYSLQRLVSLVSSSSRSPATVIGEACNQSSEWHEAAARRRALSVLELAFDNNSACRVKVTILSTLSGYVEAYSMVL